MKNRVIHAVGAGVALLFAILLLTTLNGITMDENSRNIGTFNDNNTNSTVNEHYLKDGENETGATNIVTSVVVDYRGFDTLGEVTVLFMASTGLIMLHGNGKKEEENLPAIGSSFVLRIGAKLVFPIIVLFAAYIFVHGHLTPGGGFQGGVIIATGVAFLLIVDRSAELREKMLKFTESLSGATIIFIGFFGIIFYSGFLENCLPL